MEKQLNITYESNLTNIVSVNPSFDLGILKVAYTGLNRNNSFISEETFEKCISTIYNCPIVCNYNRETGSIGSHDIEIVKEDNNTYKVINITQPVGVVPESSKYWWEDIVDNGVSHRYLCVEVLLWKRQEAYEHIKDNKVTKHSMEIDVVDGNFTTEGYYSISDFVFTALCLLESAEPCFESSALHMFSKDDFKEQFTQMMNEFKDYAIQNQSSSEVDINKNTKMEGGQVLNEEIRNSILQEFSLTLNDIDFEITDEMSEEGLRTKLEEFTNSNGKTQTNTEPETKTLFSATYRQKRDALNNALSSDIVYDSEGNLIEETYYWVADFDDTYVYVEKSHWTKEGGYDEKHGRYTYSFDETALTATITSDFEEMVLVWLTVDENQKLQEERNKFELLNTEYEEYKSNYSTPNSEVERLQKFEKDTIDSKYESDITEVFSRFEKQLNGVTEFEILKEKYNGMEVNIIEEKCFAMLGKKNANFSIKSKDTVVKLPVDHKDEEIEDSYGGLLAKKYK
jgi:hypothetical protein